MFVFIFSKLLFVFLICLVALAKPPLSSSSSPSSSLSASLSSAPSSRSYKHHHLVHFHGDNLNSHQHFLFSSPLIYTSIIPAITIIILTLITLISTMINMIITIILISKKCQYESPSLPLPSAKRSCPYHQGIIASILTELENQVWRKVRPQICMQRETFFSRESQTERDYLTLT